MESLLYSLEAEESVLGSVFFNNNEMNVIADKLLVEDFYSPNNQIIYKAMLTLFHNNSAIDIITVMTYLENINNLEKVGGREYIINLSSVVPSTANLSEYINIVKDRSVLRRLQEKFNELLEKSKNVEDAPHFIDQVEKEVFEITKNRRTSDFVNVSDIADETINKLAEREQVLDNVTGLDTRYKALNNYTLGLQPSDLLILAARPGIGKTAFALNLALNVGSLENRPHIAFFSLEMGVEQLLLRLLSAQSSIPNTKLRKADLSSGEWERLQTAVNNLKGTNIYFDDSGTVEVMDLRSKCRKLKQNNKLDLVIVDYLQLLSGSGVYKGNRVQEVSEISRVLKEMARELKVPVVALSQLSRSIEQRKGDDKRPKMSDLRESGSIEQDADIIIFLYVKDEDNDDERKRNLTQFSVAKNRHGTPGDFKLIFNKETSKFNSYSGD
ncbi:MAG: replicative DNA helicase [Candidatus Izemoplasmatales bacterium]|jgi:replicative DNA helicase|nr:replicative DNA helicase [Candidatus Izemoplasmatales bacterium]